ncbi:EAL domain-containing protein [Amorphus orientalis]|uniref:Diguanylate cyclase (GGDEF)-like protein/PAS domain S-box-containing protein n=1 Tax=Amorphus orientalis TaxID=649198 RepID=A0AAE3VQM0_9HYPH|nr:EAL domain-containing protein [Amorphus orientalis]MDQ0316158.1 diguanylate cyclase (GGDEF)-like protein/PAS domain S-box-containing protein [Amorphus orientalis]
MINLLPDVEMYLDVEDRLQVSTAPGPDGIVRRIEVRALSEEHRNWAVFALANPSDEQIDRLLVVPHFRLVGSGIVWPDLGAERVAAITPSQGFPPERQASLDSDVFRITLDPGAVVTYMAELSSPTLPQLRLWEPDAYKDSVNAYTLYKGIVLGISGLLALFLTIVFVIKGTVLFPTTAALAWVVLGYVMVDFDFWGEILRVAPSEDRVYRSATEVLLALMLAVFLYAYLNLNRWHVRYSHTMIGICVLFLGVLAVAVADPPIAAGIARIALAVIAVGGLAIVVIFAIRGYDRAIMLIPTWSLFLVWLFGAALAVTGRVDNDIVQPALDGGLVLIVLLIGFTVMQHAFAGGAIADGLIGDIERSALALVGSGDIVWDWDVTRDRIVVGKEAEERLGAEAGSLQGPPQDWFALLHPQDRDRFRATLDTMVEQRRGRISDRFRLRGIDGHFRWFHLRARPVIGSDGEVIRCVGTLLDVTEGQTREERLLHDSVYDNLTGLPNRMLFIDRLDMAMGWADEDTRSRLFVMLVNVDRFSEVNDQFGLSVGDSALLTIGRRLARVLKPHDTIARLGGDTFAILIYADTGDLRSFIDDTRRLIRTAIEFGDREIFLSASIGVASLRAETADGEELVADAELAMRRAKRLGGDRGEVYDPLMRKLSVTGKSIAVDLRQAVQRDDLALSYRPIVRLVDKAVAGFSVEASWRHTIQGHLTWSSLLPLAEREGLSTQLVLSVLERSAQQFNEWYSANPEATPGFICVPIPVAGPFRSELVNDVKAVIVRNQLEPGRLKLAVSEHVVARNPEFAAQLMHRLREVGASIAFDRFGAGSTWLGYLERMPIDTIRLESRYLGGAGKGRRSLLLRSLVGLGHDLGLQVLASGVENDADALDLLQLGVEMAEGDLFGRTLAPAAATRILQDHAAQAAE